jgi:hypothetical protein
MKLTHLSSDPVFIVIELWIKQSHGKDAILWAEGGHVLAPE